MRQLANYSRRGSLPLALVAFALLATWGSQGKAQEAANLPSASAVKLPLTASEKPLPGEVKPELYWLPDKDGNLRPVPGFTFESFIEILRIKNRLTAPDQKPRYSLQRAALTGSDDGDRAQLTAEFSIVVRENGWVKVPLRLGTAVLTKQATYEGDGKDNEHFLHFDGDGYVAWIYGAADSTHKFSLDMLVPVTSVGSEKKVKLMLPRADVSEMKLQVNGNDAVGRVSDESRLLSTQGAGEKTTFTVLGPGGEFELAWRQADALVARIPTTLEASAAVLVDIDSQRVRCEAALTVRSFGGTFNYFRVRLPPGADFVRGNGPPRAIISLVNEPAAKPQASKVLEIKLDKETAGPVEIPLVTERPFQGGDMDAPVELAGFEVLGAVRQHGHVAVQPGGSWQIDWTERRHVRQVDDLPESLRRDGVVAGFEYFLQPYSLEASIVPQKTRIQVEPTYIFRVSPQRVVLSAKLKYTVRGAKTRALTIHMPKWQVDRAGPSNLLKEDVPLTERDAYWQILLSQATSGQFEIELEAHRDLPSGLKRLDLELPIPHQVDTVGSADVYVVSASNVELDSRTDSTIGLNLQGVQAPFEAPLAGVDHFHEEALHYRSDSLPARFSADFTLKRQSVSSAVDSHIELTARDIQVAQRMNFQVSYEAISSLAVDVPRPLTQDKLNIMLDGQKTALIAKLDADAEGPQTHQRMRIALPKPRLGRLELEIGYVVPREKLLPAASVPLSVPLVMPGTGKMTRNQVTVTSETAVSINPSKGAWTISDDGMASAAQGRKLSLMSDEPSAEVTLVVRQGEKQPAGSNVIERGLVQSFLSPGGRRDRATYRFRAGEPTLRLTLPSDIERASLQVVLDGVLLRTAVDSTGRLVIPLTGGTSDEHALELRYRFAEGAHSGLARLETPHFPTGTWVERLYWQVNLPPNQHVARSPANFTSESRWTWRNFYWAREPALSDQDLKSWMGDETGPITAPHNQYLYSTMEPRAVLTLWTVRRSVVVFAASLMVLALGCALIYFPASRHPAILLTVGLLLLAGAAVDPEAALLTAQAAMLGLLLLLATLALVRHEPRPRLVPVAVRSSSQALTDRSRTQLYYRRSTATSETATAASPVAMQISASEPES